MSPVFESHERVKVCEKFEIETKIATIFKQTTNKFKDVVCFFCEKDISQRYVDQPKRQSRDQAFQCT